MVQCYHHQLLFNNSQKGRKGRQEREYITYWAWTHGCRPTCRHWCSGALRGHRHAHHSCALWPPPWCTVTPRHHQTYTTGERQNDRQEGRDMRKAAKWGKRKVTPRKEGEKEKTEHLRSPLMSNNPDMLSINPNTNMQIHNTKISSYVRTSIHGLLFLFQYFALIYGWGGQLLSWCLSSWLLLCIVFHTQCKT